MTRALALAALVSLLAGCEGGLDDGGGAGPMVHSFPAIELDAFEERTSDCQSWTLDNDEVLWVNAVEMASDPGWHHSNWLFVPEALFDGPDGTWNCNSRDYDEVEGGLAGGVLYAQSTQVDAERQAFPAGAAVRVPERSRIVAAVHVVNATDTPLETALTMTLETLPDEEVVHKLRPFVTSYFPLEIPPQVESQFSSRCDAAGANDGNPLGFSMFYVLPHYHQWGTGYFIKGHTADGEVTIFDRDNPIGDPLGIAFDPPIDLTGVTEIEFGCRYQNLSGEPVFFENDDGGEMCMMLAYADDTRKWLGGAYDVPNMVVGTDGNGVLLNEAECQMVRI